jgi:hypothetical protein
VPGCTSVWGIEDVNWAHLKHAYGRAVDTPRHLAALLGDDQDAIARALNHLEIAVLHQGYPYPAAAPVVRVVAGYLDEMAVRPAVRDSLLTFLGWTAEATRGLEGSRYDQELLHDLHEALVATYHSVYAYVDAEDLELRTTATTAALSYARCAPLRDQRPVLGGVLRRRIACGERRSWYVAKLVDIGGRVSEYLDDPEFDVRVTAALVPEMADRADSTEILVEALVRAAAETGPAANPTGDALLDYANSFINPDPWRGYSLAGLIAALIERLPDFEHIAEPAALLVRTVSWTGADRTWGPLVRAAFQPAYRAGVLLTPSQRLIIEALLANPELWSPTDGNASLVFKQAGLPRDRDQCRRLVGLLH